MASEITATRGRSSACIASSAAESWPLPPSITTRFGVAANDSSQSSDAGAGREPREAARDHLGHRGEVVLALLAAHRELAVVRLLRDAVLEHDHRADDLLALDVRDVEALDPDRQRLEVQHLAQLLERLDAARRLRLGDERLRRERELGVLLRELLQPPLLAALGRAHLDARAAQLGEELLERRRVARRRAGTSICGGTDGAAP